MRIGNQARNRRRKVLLALSGVAVGVSVGAGAASGASYNLASFAGGTFQWGTTGTWNPAAVPGSGDTIDISGNLVTANTVINYASGTATDRSITSVSVTDSDTSTAFSVTLAPGVAGSRLTFATNTPTLSTNIPLGGSARALIVQNPQFSLANTTLTKGGAGAVMLEFLTAGTVTDFNTNVSSIATTGAGSLRIAGPSGSTVQLPNLNFASTNARLVLGGAASFTASGKTITNGTGVLTVAGGTSVTFSGGTAFTFGQLITSSSNSNDFFLGGNSHLIVNNAGGTGSFTQLLLGEQWSASGTALTEVRAGLVNVSNTSYLGNPSADAQNQNLHLSLSGTGTVDFTSTTNQDFIVGRNTRQNATAPATATTVAGTLTVSGSALLDLSANTRLVLAGRSSATNIGSNVGTLNLDGGTILTAREIARGTIGTPTSGAVNSSTARVYLNGGTVRAGAAITDLFTGFGSQAQDGVFVSAGGAVIDTQAFSVGLAAALQENPASTGGALIKRGSGTLTVTGTSTFTGGVNIQSGTLQINGAANLGAGSAAVTIGATSGLRVNGNTSIARPIVVAGNDAQINTLVGATVAFTGGATSSYTAGVSDQFRFESVGATTVSGAPLLLPSQQLNKGQAGTLALAVAGNDYRRMLNFLGVVRTDVAGALDPQAEIEMRLNGTVLDLNGNDQGIGGLITGAGASTALVTSASPATLTFNNSSGTRSYVGSVVGAGLDLVMAGAGVQYLTSVTNAVDDVLASAGRIGLTGTADQLTVDSGGTLSVGAVAAAGGSISKLIVADGSLSGVVEMEIARVGTSLSHDELLASGSLVLGGTLRVTYDGTHTTTLTLGDAFDLFDGTLAGSFSVLDLPAIADPSLTWDTTGLTAGGDGTLRVVVIPEPAAAALFAPVLPLLARRRRRA